MNTAPHAVPFLKGHGTENDFLILPDPDGRLALSPEAVALLCDRRTGLGADGVLRVIRAAAHPDGHALAAQAEWFMDYRNGDGSTAEMCGNGIRVFAHYLRQARIAGATELPVATRAGLRMVREAPDGELTVEMGQAVLPDGGDTAVTVTAAGRSWPARHVDLGNPHAVAFVEDLADPGLLREAPGVSPADAYPQGVNVEFAVDRGPGRVALRVHERGSGETRSCGTGACAVMVAAARRDGREPTIDGQAAHYTVDVPGGRLRIAERADGMVEMTGPATLVAEGTLDPAWWSMANA